MRACSINRLETDVKNAWDLDVGPTTLGGPHGTQICEGWSLERHPWASAAVQSIAAEAILSLPLSPVIFHSMYRPIGSA